VEGWKGYFGWGDTEAAQLASMMSAGETPMLQVLLLHDTCRERRTDVRGRGQATQRGEVGIGGTGVLSGGTFRRRGVPTPKRFCLLNDGPVSP
jgi:hypothetical protein